ncbi:hypothetical protein HUE56_28125 (plasmid) [Azospirillum oryzae]|uniref:Uncharacterized protein n=1 Tax=Azospirillum oryzae TaxID=286727 RepID=A0A6N1ASM3_9PROT|nr:hypothetical protein [Azospirillum oryzae]QKS54323.1 hypothetical protein HUE56_28125 [Azospirillum oryzae]GLR78897.1 hypothetical protein GCM10007856_15710 [Azospirillum oryzae]
MTHHVLSPDTAAPCTPPESEAAVERLRALARLLGRMAAREYLARSGEPTQPPKPQ